MKNKMTRNVILMAVVTVIMAVALSLYIQNTGTVPVLAIYKLRPMPIMRVTMAIRIAFLVSLRFMNSTAPFQKTAYFAGLKLSRRVTTRLYTPGFLLSGVKKPVRTNWNCSPGFASARASSSLQSFRTTTLSGFR